MHFCGLLVPFHITKPQATGSTYNNNTTGRKHICLYPLSVCTCMHAEGCIRQDYVDFKVYDCKHFHDETFTKQEKNKTENIITNF